MKILKTLWYRIKSKLFELKNGAHQYSNNTDINRYPEIFEFVSSKLKERDTTCKILSFGCSTGEECFSINNYLPNSSIVGADINKGNLKIAQKRFNLPNIKYVVSEHKVLMEDAPFDAIFCMSVLCRWRYSKDTSDLTKIYPFSMFEEKVKELDQLLAVNGFLVIYNANYRFSDLDLAGKYIPLEVPGLETSGFVNKFGIDSKLLSDQNYNFCVFQKVRLN